ELLEAVVGQVTADKDLWLDTMMRDELNIIEDRKNPFVVGLVTFVAFVVFGSVPLIGYVLSFLMGHGGTDHLFKFCLISTAVALFGVGASRARFSLQSWMRSGFEILLLGGTAGAVAYYVGVLLKEIV